MPYLECTVWFLWKSEFFIRGERKGQNGGTDPAAAAASTAGGDSGTTAAAALASAGAGRALLVPSVGRRAFPISSSVPSGQTQIIHSKIVFIM